MTVNTEQLEGLGTYEYGWSDSDSAGATAKRGLSEAVVRDISAKKSEPQWMLDMRLKGLRLFERKPMPTFGADLSGIDFDNIKYFVRSTEKQATSWEDLPDDIKNTYDRLGIPEAEKQRLVAGVAAQYESEVVYHKIREDLEEQGVIFLDTDTGLREHEELFKEYFGTVIPVGDNKFSALNTSVWSGGSFIYVPPGVNVEIPLQAYFRINTENMGQFERTLIIVDEGAYVHYVEGCTAPIYSSDSLHSAVVEIIVKKDARCRYTTIQNWSNNVYNLVTKRAVAHEGATMEWVDGNIGSKVTMKYPAVWLVGEHAKGENINLQYPKRFKIILVPFDLGAAFHGRVHHRNDTIEPILGDNKPADMLGQMAGKTIDFLRHFQNLGHGYISRIKSALFSFALANSRAALMSPYRTRQGPDGIFGKAEDLANFPCCGTRAIGDDRCCKCGAFAAVFTVDVLDYLLAAFMLEIHINIRGFTALW